MYHGASMFDGVSEHYYMHRKDVERKLGNSLRCEF